ncbi:hypothetical protein [Kibdelosporangium phytohabitans]|uniref:Uncharacterized protein n=1 Tax=Kibdelosporangium phytohabitans TaxID=860235 RepID=A0A0N9HT28_9PSEU|nr:hypothetical protein [Kibdelosporangium phytohabitans]ALG08206.1 hypothetical protein AOZ06_15970 [Kibdelosporangium phytohabitans]MBE1470791.1 hypothetical protein [Kibdelosporangium phytohabitans]
MSTRPTTTALAAVLCCAAATLTAPPATAATTLEITGASIAAPGSRIAVDITYECEPTALGADFAVTVLNTTDPLPEPTLALGLFRPCTGDSIQRTVTAPALTGAFSPGDQVSVTVVMTATTVPPSVVSTSRWFTLA